MGKYDNKLLNKELRIKSILEDYHRFNELKREYANLSLNSQDKPEKDFSKVEIFEIEMVIESTDVNIKRRLYVMENITDEALITKNFKIFEEIAKANNYSDKIAGLIFVNLIKDTRYEDTLPRDSYKALKAQLLRILYSASTKQSIVNKMNNIVQTYSTSIKEYIHQIEEAVERYSRVENLTKSEKVRKIEELFYKGLGPYTTMYIGDFFTKDSLLSEITEHLINKECNIVLSASKMFKESETVNREDINPGKYNSKRQQRWCSFHKNHSHNTVDCFTLKNKQMPREKTDTKSFIIKESMPKSVEEIIVDITANGKAFEAVIDTGSKNSYISPALQSILQLDSIETKAIKAVYGNGNSELLNRAVEVDLNMGNGVKSRETLYVANSASRHDNWIPVYVKK